MSNGIKEIRFRMIFRETAENTYAQNSQEFGHLHRKEDIKFK